ncbi:hypothetical protein DRO56_00615 [Candidatus Bathyarchaeota archaeon]|nr:MAG: hypothetical protein CW700_05525 [Candidatus Bathyarchaeota archaeon]RLI33889.1 MAG: hypothetical protein DRO56_00615 [Candidatus Bathyarchaeota archaeon]
MRTPCEFAVRYLLPAFRALVARELVTRHNFSQTKAAEGLGITQASISHYLHSKRGKRALEELERNPALREFARETARQIAIGEKSPEEISRSLCKLCTTLREHFVETSPGRELS